MLRDQQQQMQQQQMQQEEPTVEDIENSFRNGIDDCISIVEALGPLCRDINELVEMLTLAKKNDAQLHLIMNRVAPAQLRKVI